MSICIEFRTELHGCINHKCWAWVHVKDFKLTEVVDWSDGYSTYTEVPMRVWTAIEQAVEAL